jgi:hypothetical protein
MSRKSGRGNGTRRQNTASQYNEDFKGFADVPLGDAGREMVVEMLASHYADMCEMLDRMVAGGYKVSITLNPRVRSVIATATGREGTDENEGYALSGFGPNAMGALACLFIKHFQICHEGPWIQVDEDGLVQQDMFR